MVKEHILVQVFTLGVLETLLLVTHQVQAIGYFWNGQTASISGLYEAELFDVERVEVLRGPQGTFFGSGTTGGAVQMLTKRPDADVGGYIKADIAEYDSTRLSGASIFLFLILCVQDLLSLP